MNEHKQVKEFYRYELRDSSCYLDFYPTYELRLIVFKVCKETPMGYWITRGFPCKNRWVEKRKARKKYARDTKKRALECYIFRTERRVGYLNKSLNMAKQGLDLADTIQNNQPKEENPMAKQKDMGGE